MGRMVVGFELHDGPCVMDGLFGSGALTLEFGSVGPIWKRRIPEVKPKDKGKVLPGIFNETNIFTVRVQ